MSTDMSANGNTNGNANPIRSATAALVLGALLLPGAVLGQGWEVGDERDLSWLEPGETRLHTVLARWGTRDAPGNSLPEKYVQWDRTDRFFLSEDTHIDPEHPHVLLPSLLEAPEEFAGPRSYPFLHRPAPGQERMPVRVVTYNRFLCEGDDDPRGRPGAGFRRPIAGSHARAERAMIGS